MNTNNIRVLKNISKKWYIRVPFIIVVMCLTIWLCDNLPYLIKQLILLLS